MEGGGFIAAGPPPGKGYEPPSGNCCIVTLKYVLSHATPSSCEQLQGADFARAFGRRKLCGATIARER